MGKISNQQVLEKLTDKFATQFTNVSEPYGLLTLETSRNNINLS
jgi:NADH-quinone oxidoreductase subunit C